MVDCKTRLGLFLRALLIVFFLAGISLVVLGFVIDPSPSSPLSLLLSIVGVLTSLSAFIGCCASYGTKCCTRAFLLLSPVILLFHGSGLLGLFISPDKMINSLSDNEEEQQDANRLLTKGQWIFLGVFTVECLATTVGVLLHCCCSSEFEFEPFEESLPTRQFDLAKVRASIKKTPFEIDSNLANKKLRQKMAKKYGQYSHTTDWGTEKKWWSLNQLLKTRNVPN